uniref:CNH domain-containing protein n=1 Tax=Plectus sambesii TaxID=2011161 RepID=A0A914VBK9_9BILA
MAVRVFDLVPAIDLSDAAGAVENEMITSMEGCGNNLFVGTSVGRVISFSLREEVSEKAKVVVSASVWAQQRLPTNAPIVKMVSASALETLLVLSAGTLYYLTLQDLKPRGASMANNIACFSLNSNPQTDDPFTLQGRCVFQPRGASMANNIACFSLNSNPQTDDPFTLQIAIGTLRKTILVCEKPIDSDKLKIWRKIAIDEAPLAVSYDGSCLCYATDANYYVYDINSDAQQVLFPIDSGQVRPLVERINKEEFILNGMQGLGVFAKSDGVSSRPPVFWGVDYVHSVTYLYPHLIALGEQFIAFYSIIDQQLKQRLPFSEGRCVGNFDGQAFVATRREVFKLLPVSWDKQVESLLEENQVSEALEVTEVSLNRIGYDEKHILTARRLRQKAAFVYFVQGKRAEALELMVDNELDPRELISLYPGLLPSQSDFTRASPSLHQLANIAQVTSAANEKQSLLDFLKDFLLQVRSRPWISHCAKDIDTALVKLLAQEGDPSAFEKFLATNCVCDVDDCLEWIADAGMHHCKAILLLRFGQATDAFGIWKKLALEELTDPQFPEMKDCIGRLTKCAEKDVFAIVPWIVALDAEATVEAILNCKYAIDEMKMADLLEKHPQALLYYLRKLIDDKSCNIAQLHTRLALLYLDRISQLKADDDHTKDEDIADLRKRLRRFLSQSNYYDVKKVLGEIEGVEHFLSEKAFILGKNGSYANALQVLVGQLRDFEGAEDFCAQMAVNLDRRERHHLYLSLLNAFLTANRRCAVCQHHFVDSDALRYPTGSLVHRHCLRNPNICPVTNSVIM